MTGAERRFALFILAIFLAVDAAIIGAAAASWSSLVPDFFSFWSTAQFLQTHRAADAYDLALVGAFQHALRSDFTAVYPAPYSPVFLLAIRPLAWFSYAWAHLLWVTVTLGAFAWAGLAALRRRDLALLLLLTPLTALGAVYGQTGFLTGALMIGTVLLMDRRPILAGLCLALLSFKPQLGLLMPLMLLARRDWRTFGATIAWLAALALLTSAALGWTIWWDWLHALAGHGQLMADSRAQLIGIMTTITSAVLTLGGSLPLAHAIQIAAGIAVAAVVWTAWRRADHALAAAATWTGSFLVTPYAFVYDTPVAMCAALLFLRESQRDPARGRPALDLGIVVFVLIAPLFILAAPPQPPAAPFALLALFLALAWRILRTGRREASR